MKAQTVTIVGMGRVGASIALALKAASAGLTVVGHDRLRDVLQQAKDQIGAIDRAEWNLINAAAAADILVIDVSIADLESTLMTIGDDLQAHTLVLDLSSLKGQGLKWAAQYLKRGHYVGARAVLAAPYLNDGRAEVSAATADLFHNSLFGLMPSPKADPQAVETAVNFGRLLGAVPYFVDPLEYDSLVQGVETLPGLVAAAEFAAIQKTAAWRDMLRFASSPFALSTQPLEMGTDITRLALNDKAATLRWLDALLQELTALRRVIHEGDWEMLDLTVSNLFLERERWFKNRSENDWQELPSQPDTPTMSETLLGSWVSRGRKKDDKDR